KLNHSYDTNGNYTIKIKGDISAINQEAFLSNNNLISVIIPNTVSKIDWYAFRGCSNLTYVDLPNTLTQINNYCFYMCSITTVILRWETSNDIINYSSSWFSGNLNTLKYYIPLGTRSLYISKKYPSNQVVERNE
uniref:leucine-rich repeat domain-containing protein n=1 Tax=Methanobrevibacter sp. TaxID=66852 RepID=UPI00388F67CF